MDRTRFLENQWYVAATVHEVGDTPFARMICDQPLLLYRRASGEIVCLENRCAHRKYPLSRGTIVDDEIQCGYHGLRFAHDGRCTLIPAQSAIPRNLGVRVYPVLERFAYVFVWMGDPARADESLLPEFPENNSPGWAPAHGYHHVKANYQLLIDNLLDLTHVTFVHKTTLSGPGLQENPLQIEMAGDVMHAKRVMRNVDPAPIFRIIRTFPGKIHRSQTIDVRLPVYIRIKVGAVAVDSDEDVNIPHHVVINCLVPETERSTHYFWAVPRCQNIHDPEVTRKLIAANQTAFDEDQAVIEAQQEMIDNDPSARPLVNLEADKASVIIRRLIQRKLEEEAGRPAAVA